MKIIEKVRILCLILSISIIGSFTIDNVNASEIIDNNDGNLKSYFIDFIPDYMQPGSKIEFITDNKFIVIEGDVSENTFIAPSNDSNYPPEVYVEEYPVPIKGMIVTYADDGLINKIIYPEGVEDPLLREKAQIWKMKDQNSNVYFDFDELNNIQPYLSSGCYSTTRFAVWGAYPNSLYLCKVSVGTGNEFINLIYGTGRATTFSDVIGQGNRVLKKGDVATQLSHDNVALGTRVSVKTKNISGVEKTYVMTKNDAGSMPNAVLDIWKSGVEYWGYTWNSNFSMPYSVQYRH